MDASLAGATSLLSPTGLATGITAVGALGTAAYGLVDASKVFGGVSSSGFTFITTLVDGLCPNDNGIPADSGITRTAILDTLKGAWINGMATADQKSTAKTLIKLRLNPGTAANLAVRTGVDPDKLKVVAQKLTAGVNLGEEPVVGGPGGGQSGEEVARDLLNAYGRFDLILATLIDRAYQRADQRYRNTAKAWSCIVAVLLAELAAALLVPYHAAASPLLSGPAVYWLALVAGLSATPLAPIAKDLSTSINNAAKAVQALRGRS